MVDVVHELIDDEQAEMRIWPPADFCGFGLEHAVEHAHWMQMSHDSGMVTVHHICQFSSALAWIIVD